MRTINEPEAVSADPIYGNRANRKYLKGRDIRFSGKAIGRPPKGENLDEAIIKAHKKRRKYEISPRNRIEGKFGESKRAYELGPVKTSRTSEAWIAAVLFVMNLARWLRDFFFVFFLRPLSRLFSNPFCFQRTLYRAGEGLIRTDSA